MSTPPRKHKANGPPELTRHNTAAHTRKENGMKRRYEKWLETPVNKRDPENTDLFETKELLTAASNRRSHTRPHVASAEPYNWAKGAQHKGGRKRVTRRRRPTRR